jgi:predicted transcriptional regulator
MSAENLEEFLKVAESRAVDVLFWLLNNRDSENRVNTTLETVAGECKVTKVTVNRVFQRLYEKEFMVKIRNGQYQLKGI